MKQLSAEEAKNIVPLKGGRYTWVYARLLVLKIGEALIIEKKDWITKRGPVRTVRCVEKNTGYRFTFGRLADCSGWFARREK